MTTRTLYIQELASNVVQKIFAVLRLFLTNASTCTTARLFSVNVKPLFFLDNWFLLLPILCNAFDI